MRHSRRGGFTLVELLVVIGIIAMLISILLPTLHRVRELGKQTVCLSNLRQIGLGVGMYANENKGFFPPASHTAAPTGWLNTLIPYGIDPKVRLCPNDLRRPEPPTSYLTNDHMQSLKAWTDFDPTTGGTLPGGRSRPYTKLVDVRRSSMVVFVAESLSIGDHLHSVGWSTPAEVENDITVRRHHDRANYLYVDGHAASVAWSTIQRTFNIHNSFLNPETAQ